VRIRVLSTLGPASLDPHTIRRLGEAGVDLFRINLSHTALDDVEETIGLVRRSTDKPVCLDTEGSQVRCGVVEPGLVLAAGRGIELVAEAVVGSAERLTLRPPAVFEALEAGSVMTVDFDGATLEVVAVGPDGASAVVVQGGRIGSNKAVLLHPSPALPALSAKDLGAIDIGVRCGIREFAVSFARTADDVALVRSLTPPGSTVIAKIESRAGVRNMDGIIAAADAVLIDRGDLSLEVPLEEVPFYQKVLIRRSNLWTRPVYVATNLLESMTTNRRPTVAEANDIANTLLDGVHGLVLAAETAIGINPVGSVEMIVRLIDAFERQHRVPAMATPPAGVVVGA